VTLVTTILYVRTQLLRVMAEIPVLQPVRMGHRRACFERPEKQKKRVQHCYNGLENPLPSAKSPPGA
jgi:hypothetical protein